MREIISLHIGQAGIQLGNDLWDLYTKGIFLQFFFVDHIYKNNIEQGISSDGTRINNTSEKGLETFFSETGNGKYVPRAIMADLEPNVIDQIKTGLYHPDD